MASFLSSTRIQKEEPREVFFDSPSFINQNSTIQASSCYTPNRAQNGSTTVMENRPSGQIEQALLKSSIYDKCQALGLALKDNNNMKELERLYPIIVQKIFGFGSYPPGWGIQTLHRTKSRKDSEALLDFLSPTGPLFTHLIYKLLAEPIAFNFPKGFIPESTKRKLDEGMQVTDMFHKDRFMFSDQLSEAVLPLDAFQYYFFIFAHKMVDSTTKTQELYLEPGDWVYPTLLNSYLQFFLPMTGIPDQPSYSPYYMKSQQQATPRVSYVQPRSNYRIKSEPTTSFILGLKQPKTTTPTNEAHVLWRSEKLMQILAEFWMSQSSLDIDNYSYVVKTMSLPSHDLIMLVRMVVKHVHSFIHALDNNVLPSHLQNPETVMGSFKRSLLGSCLQKPLYSFLRHTIEKWPLDTSFRPILETWLTYIRPWRYAASGGNESKQSAGDEESKPVDFSLWDEFVRGNSLFYTVLFQDMLTRFHRIDLTASKMAFQLSRVCKVFNEPQLIDKLRQVDLSMTEFISAYHNHTITGDVTGGLIERTRALLDNQIINLEASNFVCRPMFCDDVMQMGANLLQELVNSQYKVRKAMNKIGEKSKPSKGPSLLSFLGLEQIADFNEAISGNSNREYESTQKCIEQCIGDLSQIFQLELPDCDLSSSTDTLTDTGSEDLPDHVTKADGRVELTTLGRYQLLNGMRRFPNIDYQGDPELQPVRSFESDIAVTQLYKLSSELNNKYGDWFNEQYNQGGIKGSIARRVLDLPPRTVCASRPRPRLSLRFLANYYFLGYSLVAYLVLSTLLGRLPTIVLVILCLLFYILTMSLIDLWNSR